MKDASGYRFPLPTHHWSVVASADTELSWSYSPERCEWSAVLTTCQPPSHTDIGDERAAAGLVEIAAPTSARDTSMGRMDITPSPPVPVARTVPPGERRANAGSRGAQIVAARTPATIRAITNAAARIL